MGRKLRVLDLFSGYTIREDGVVTSRFGRGITHQISRNGYVRVELWQSGSGKKYLVHRLLAEAFIPNPQGFATVNHIDGDKLNNALSNLEWASQSDNQKHAYRIGLQKGYRKSVPLNDAHKSALSGSRWNHETHKYRLDGSEFNNLSDAASHFGLSRQTVLNRCKSERWPNWTKSIERR